MKRLLVVGLAFVVVLSAKVVGEWAVQVKQTLQLLLMIDGDTELYDITGSYRRITYHGPLPDFELRDAGSGNESRSDTSEEPQKTQPDSLEMADLLKLFMLPAGATYNVQPWHIGAEPGSPIEWYTSGIDNSPAWPNLGPYHRRGEVVLMFSGQVTHHVLRERLVPGTWEIYLHG